MHKKHLFCCWCYWLLSVKVVTETTLHAVLYCYSKQETDWPKSTFLPLLLKIHKHMCANLQRPSALNSRWFPLLAPWLNLALPASLPPMWSTVDAIGCYCFGAAGLAWQSATENDDEKRRKGCRKEREGQFSLMPNWKSIKNVCSDVPVFA